MTQAEAFINYNRPAIVRTTASVLDCSCLSRDSISPSPILQENSSIVTPIPVVDSPEYSLVYARTEERQTFYRQFRTFGRDGGIRLQQGVARGNKRKNRGA